MDTKKLKDFVEAEFAKSFLPGLMEFVKVPSCSPGFDSASETNMLADKCIKGVAHWIDAQKVKGCTVRMYWEPKRSHLLLTEIDAFAPSGKKSDKTILFYCHLDKQPPMTEGWETEKTGLHPYQPVVKEGRLYGRGASDDGYAAFAIILAIKAIQEQNLPHDRIVFVAEACEESGSVDLGYYMSLVKDIIKTPSLMVIMDSGCGDYNRLWVTTSLRGNVKVDFKVSILDEAVHSGDAGGIVPDSFRIVRALLDRIDDEKTGKVIDDFQVKIPEKRYKEVQEAAKLLGKSLYDHFKFVAGSSPMADLTDPTKACFELLLNRTWKANVAILGAEGLPPIKDAGNVLRAWTAIRASMRIPPTLDPEAAKKKFAEILTTNVPYGAKVEITGLSAGSGLNAPEMDPKFEKIVTDASNHFYSNPPVYYGEGGSIPFLCSLHKQFPKAEFLITGVLGPGSNAHAPKEMLDLDYTKKMICILAYVVAEHTKL